MLEKYLGAKKKMEDVVAVRSTQSDFDKLEGTVNLYITEAQYWIG